jgi:hypothetical protein
MTSRTKDQLDRDFQVILRNTNKNEKLAWGRKHKKLLGLVKQTEPIQEKILELLAQKQVVLDEIIMLRKTMVRECVHSPEFLIHHGDAIECKFCESKIKVNVRSSL